MSSNIIQNGILKRVAGRGLMDAALSATSRNGVQNRILKAKFDEIEDSISDLGDDVSTNSQAITQLTSDLSGKANVSNTVIDVTDEFAINANVYFSVTFNPVANTISIIATGTGNFPNDTVEITFPSKYAQGLMDGYVIGATGMIRTSTNQFGYVMGKAFGSGLGWKIIYSVDVTAEQLAFSITYHIS